MTHNWPVLALRLGRLREECDVVDNSGGGEGDSSSGRTPASKRGVPRATLESAEKLAVALWNAARMGSVPQGAFAREVSGPKAKASGGAWRTKMALIRVFGLAEVLDNEEVKLSGIGRQIVNSAEPAQQLGARRASILQVPPYASLLASSSGQELPSEASITGTFEFSYALSHDDAVQAAKNFVASVKLAEMLDGSGKVIASIVGKDSSVSDEPEPKDEAKMHADNAKPDSAKPPADQIADQHGEALAKQQKLVEQQKLLEQQQLVLDGTPNGIELTLSIDMSEWAPDDVLRVLKSLRLATDV
jgi:hypothetical protein